MQVFISHAGSDATRVTPVAQALQSAGLGVTLDRNEIRPGDGFLAFMEQALVESDYCLLLWSKAAAERKWVEAEWQAALHRTIVELRRFLIVGRLEDHPQPALLAPRLYVDLFPELSPGIDELISLWEADQVAAVESGRPVGRPTLDVVEDAGGETIYVTSELFRLTIPLRASLDTPAGVYLDRLVSDLKLPQRYDFQGLMGVEYKYSFVFEDRQLVREQTLVAQAVRPRSSLGLEVEMKPFAAETPTAGELSKATFRAASADTSEATIEAERVLLRAASKAGLRY